VEESSQAVAPLSLVTRRADVIAGVLLVAALGLLALFPLTEAIGRPLGGLHIPGTAAYVRQLTLWIVFIGGLLTTLRKQHLTLSTTEFLGHGRLRSVARWVAGALAAATTAVLAYAATQVVVQDRVGGKIIPGGVPEWASEVVMPVSLALMAVVFAWQAADGWWGRCLALVAAGAAFSLGLVPEGVAAWAGMLTLLVVATAVLGAPIFVVMGALALLLFFKDGTPVAAVSAEVSSLMASPLLPAIPLLTACGYVLAEGGASERLLRFFRALFGWMPGGLALIVVAVCALFTTFTGGSGVTIVAVGGLLMPMLKRDGYPEGFSLGLVTAAGSLGLLFPPSLPVILYSVVASASGRAVPADSLYLAGLVPGVLMVALVAGYGMVVGWRIPGARERLSARGTAVAAWGAKWELALPLILIALFAGGWTSMIETAAAALAFTVVTQWLLMRDLSLARLASALTKAGTLMGAVLILLSVAKGLTAYFVQAEIAARLMEWVVANIHSKFVFLLALNALLLVVGCLIDIFSAIVVVVPLIAPIAVAFGVDPVHLGIVFLANLELGFLTPPVGMNLFLSSSRFRVPLMRVWRDTLPFLLVLLVGVLAITYLPALTVGVAELFGKGAVAVP
jgi:C4-dicarboxylate transporter, DctM subunit